jgi:hypothetical protein
MFNELETNQLLELNGRLMTESEMIGWLCTAHSNRVHYQNNPEATNRVQQQLNKASNLICLAYIWALLEEHGFNEKSRWIRTKDRLELKAWKHVRHTGAHAPGGRANRYCDEFNCFMSSGETGLSGLKQNCKFSETSIDLTDGMNYRFFQFVQELTKVAIGHCANGVEPA